jgi:hypothetical protein
MCGLAIAPSSHIEGGPLSDFQATMGYDGGLSTHKKVT